MLIKVQKFHILIKFSKFWEEKFQKEQKIKIKDFIKMLESCLGEKLASLRKSKFKMDVLIKLLN